MAAVDVYVDLEQLKTEIINLNDKNLQEIDKAMKAVCTTVATLSACGWSGEAKEAFMKKFAVYKKSMRALYENTKEFNKRLKAIQLSGKKLIS